MELPEGTDYARSSAIRDKMLELGVIVRPIGECIAFCPPLIIDDADIDQCVDALAQAIQANPL